MNPKTKFHALTLTSIMLVLFSGTGDYEVFQAARRGKWKAVRYGMEAPVELYNIVDDPGENKELSESMPEIHREFVDLFTEHAG